MSDGNNTDEDGLYNQTPYRRRSQSIPFHPTYHSDFIIPQLDSGDVDGIEDQPSTHTHHAHHHAGDDGSGTDDHGDGGKGDGHCHHHHHHHSHIHPTTNPMKHTTTKGIGTSIHSLVSSYKNSIKATASVLAGTPRDIVNECQYFISKPIILLNELLCGITMSVIEIPSSISFAYMAHQEPSAGFYATFFMMCICAILGARPGMVSGAAGATCAVLKSMIGPGGALEHLTREEQNNALFMAVAFSGIVSVLFSWLKVAQFLKLLPQSAMIGFMNGLAIVIAMAQLFVFEECTPTDGNTYTFSQCPSEFKHYISIRSLDCWLIIILLIVTIIIMFLFPRIPIVGRWVPPSLISMVVGSLIEHFIFRKLGVSTRTLEEIAPLKADMPSLRIPEIAGGSGTWGQIILHAVYASFVGTVESVLTVITTCEYLQQPVVDAMLNREAFALGIANLISGFGGAVGGCGLIGESNLNLVSNARHRVSAFTGGLFSLFILLWLSPVVNFIPVVSLAGVIFVIALRIFYWPTFWTIHKMRKHDALIIIVGTVLAVLTNLGIAMAVGFVLASINLVFDNYYSFNTTAEDDSMILGAEHFAVDELPILSPSPPSSVPHTPPDNGHHSPDIELAELSQRTSSPQSPDHVQQGQQQQQQHQHHDPSDNQHGNNDSNQQQPPSNIDIYSIEPTIDRCYMVDYLFCSLFIPGGPLSYSAMTMQQAQLGGTDDDCCQDGRCDDEPCVDLPCDETCGDWAIQDGLPIEHILPVDDHIQQANQADHPPTDTTPRQVSSNTPSVSSSPSTVIAAPESVSVGRSHDGNTPQDHHHQDEESGEDRASCNPSPSTTDIHTLLAPTSSGTTDDDGKHQQARDPRHHTDIPPTNSESRSINALRPTTTTNSTTTTTTTTTTIVPTTSTENISIYPVKVYRLNGLLFFGSARHFSNSFVPGNDPHLIVFDFANVMLSDLSTTNSLLSVLQKYSQMNKRVKLINLIFPKSRGQFSRHRQLQRYLCRTDISTYIVYTHKELTDMKNRKKGPWWKRMVRRR